jgi:hypothetical protein
MTKDQKILKHSLYAQWHMHSASNGHCETRTVMTGADNRLLSPEELRDDAMKTSMRHIEIINEIIECPDNKWGENNV